MTIVHPEYEKHGTLEHLKLGKLEAKKDPHNLKLARYLPTAKVGAMPVAPVTFDVSGKVTSWPMYGNDELSDCTTAAAGHMIEAWTSQAKGKTYKPTENMVEKVYWETGVPPAAKGVAGSSADDGRYCTDVLNYWRKNGVGTHKIVGYAEVNPRSTAQSKLATYLFGGLYLGVALPISAQTQQIWAVVPGFNSRPGSWGGHCIDVVSYDASGLTVVTWGALQRMTWGFFSRYCDEAYAVLSQDWLDTNGESIGAELNLAQLQADITAITSVK